MSRSERHHRLAAPSPRPPAVGRQDAQAHAAFGELVERARLLAGQGWQRALELRERVELGPLARVVYQGLEESGEQLLHGRTRLGRSVRGLRQELQRWHEDLLHRLGLATSTDLDRMARQLRALRSRLRRDEDTPGEVGRPVTA